MTLYLYFDFDLNLGHVLSQKFIFYMNLATTLLETLKNTGEKCPDVEMAALSWWSGNPGSVSSSTIKRSIHILCQFLNGPAQAAVFVFVPALTILFGAIGAFIWGCVYHVNE